MGCPRERDDVIAIFNGEICLVTCGWTKMPDSKSPNAKNVPAPRQPVRIEPVSDPPPITYEVKHTHIVREERRDWAAIISASGVAVSLVILALAKVI